MLGSILELCKTVTCPEESALDRPDAHFLIEKCLVAAMCRLGHQRSSTGVGQTRVVGQPSRLHALRPR